MNDASNRYRKTIKHARTVFQNVIIYFAIEIFRYFFRYEIFQIFLEVVSGNAIVSFVVSIKALTSEFDFHGTISLIFIAEAYRNRRSPRLIDPSKILSSARYLDPRYTPVIPLVGFLIDRGTSGGEQSCRRVPRRKTADLYFFVREAAGLPARGPRAVCVPYTGCSYR